MSRNPLGRSTDTHDSASGPPYVSRFRGASATGESAGTTVPQPTGSIRVQPIMTAMRGALLGAMVLGIVGQASACVRVGTGDGARVPAYQAERTDSSPAVERDTPPAAEVEPARAEPTTTMAQAGSSADEDTAVDTVERGTASWYGEAHHGKTTASGEPFDMYAMTAAHPTLEMGMRVEVENLSNGRTVIVRINDRGPYADDRIIDVSMAAAQALGFVAAGTAEVEVRTLR